MKDHQLPNLFNSIVLVDSAGWKVIARKQLLPSYDVFDEKRYFRPSQESGKVTLKVQQKIWHLGITICEDLWVEDDLQNQRIQGPDPIEKLKSQRDNLNITATEDLNTEVEVYGIFTRAEEVGLFGASLVAESGILPKQTAIISIESSSVLPGVNQGSGPIIRTGDAAKTFDSSAEAILSRGALSVQKSNSFKD